MGPDAIQRLKGYLGQRKEEGFPSNVLGLRNLDYCVDRFGLAYRTAGSFGPDEVVLLRQAVRWSGMKEIRVDRPVQQLEEMDDWLRNAALTWTQTGYLSVGKR